MLKFIAKRLANYVVMLFVAISCTYFLASGFMRPRSNYESRTPRPPAASINRSLDLANINDHTNIFTRYWRWLTGVVTRWDWGLSPDLGSVNGALAPRIVASTELVTIATVLSIVLGVALGIYTAQRQYKWQDRLFGTTATFFLVIPTAVFALLVVMLAIFINGASGFRLFYVTGLSSYTGNNWFLRLADFGQHIILPTIVLTILGMVSYHLTQRTYLLDARRLRAHRPCEGSDPPPGHPSPRVARIPDSDRRQRRILHRLGVHRRGHHRIYLRHQRLGPVLHPGHSRQRHQCLGRHRGVRRCVHPRRCAAGRHRVRMA